MAACSQLRTLRGILRELRLSTPLQGPTRSVFGYNYLLEEYKSTRNADKETVEAQQRDADNYLCLLKSQRARQELEDHYKGRGERSVEDVAKMVGFKMPKEYKEH